MRFRAERFQYRDLNDRNVGLGIHDHQRYENPVVVASLSVCLEIHAFFLEFSLHVVPQLCCAADGISKVVSLRRKAIIVIIKRRIVIIYDSPLAFLPMCREEQDGLGLRICLFNILKLFVEKRVFLFVDERHWSSAVSDKDRSHLRELSE